MNKPRQSATAKEKLQRAFGKRLATIRKQKGLSQFRLAKLTGLQAGYINKIEKGQFEVRLYTVRRLAEGLDIKQGELMDF